MSKPMTVTTAIIAAIITEINEEVTAVTHATIDHVITIVQDSIHEDCTWHGNAVTYADIKSAVEAWIDENVEAPAADRIVEDVDTSYDDDAIDEALDAIRDAVRDGRPYARLIEEAHGLGCSRYAISDVIREAQSEVNA